MYTTLRRPWRVFLPLILATVISIPTTSAYVTLNNKYNATVDGNIKVCYDANIPSTAYAALYQGIYQWSVYYSGDTLGSSNLNAVCSGTAGVNWNLKFRQTDLYNDGTCILPGGYTSFGSPSPSHSYAIVYLDSYCWSSYYTANNSSVPSNKISLASLSKHESGHAIGLGHPPAATYAVMDPNDCCFFGQYFFGITTDDINGLAFLY